MKTYILAFSIMLSSAAIVAKNDVKVFFDSIMKDRVVVEIKFSSPQYNSIVIDKYDSSLRRRSALAICKYSGYTALEGFHVKSVNFENQNLNDSKFIFLDSSGMIELKSLFPNGEYTENMLRTYKSKYLRFSSVTCSKSS